MSVSNGVYESALARIDALERERDEALDAAVEDRQWCEAARAARKAVEAANERLRAALTQIENLHGGYPDDYCSIARAALAGGAGARWKEGKARVLCRRSKAPVGYTGPICSCGAMECAAGGVGDTAADPYAVVREMTQTVIDAFGKPGRHGSMRWRWYRAASRLRCAVGLHRLRGHIDCGDGVNVAPYDPHTRRPARGAWRVCTWCGARWVAAYDGISPFWWRRGKRGDTAA